MFYKANRFFCYINSVPKSLAHNKLDLRAQGLGIADEFAQFQQGHHAKA